MFKNIIFDCSDTLLRLESVDYLTELCGSRERAKRIHAALFLSEEWKDYDRGVLTEERAADVLLPLLPQEDREIGTIYFQNWSQKYSVIEGIPELLKELKALGCRLYVLSDYPGRFEQVWERFDIFRQFDGRVVSYETGCRKLDGTPFELILEKYGLEKEDTFFTDDYLGCINAAIKHGITAHQFTDVPTLRKALGLN